MPTMLLMNKEAVLTLGSEVRRLRGISGLSQERLAEKLGITREAVSAIERGKTKRPDDTVLEGFEVHLGLMRQRAYELMGSVPSIEQEDLLETVIQISKLQDHSDRMAKWRELPPAMQYAVHQWAQDLLLDAALQVRGASEQASRRGRHR